jgi:peptide/nickel transport system substrate-binding protein
MAQDYWQSLTSGRLSRRSAVAGTGGAALGAAFLAACGGGGSAKSTSSGESSTSKDKSGLVAEPSDTTSKAKAGGTIKTFYTADVLHFDALASNSSSTVNDATVFAYSRMVKFTTTKHPKPYEGGIEGDMMESWEVSPDKLTITFKLRQGMKWDPQAPTSNRPIDTEDILFSWKKFGALNPSAANLVYDATKAPGAPVESLSAPDARTIVMKLKQPDSALMTTLAGWDQFYPMPRESDSGFDPKTTVRGYGPWMLDDYRASAYTHWKRNPNFYVKDRPFPDRMERALIPEFAARIAQFKAGNIHTDIVEQAQDSVLQLKKDLPQTSLYLGAGGNGRNYASTISNFIIFGYEGNSIFKDVRMRQAMSMAIDREAIADSIENRAIFEKEGLDNAIAANSALSPAWNGYWIDPNNEKEFGPTAKYLKHNVAEAKKLLTAAGYPNGVEFDFFHNRENTYGVVYSRLLEIYASMLPDVGLRAKLQGQAYATWQPQYYQGYVKSAFDAGRVKGFNGAGLSAERSRYTAVMSLYGLFHVQGDAFHGASYNGGPGNVGDPKMNDLLAKLRLESDNNKIKEGVKEAQKYLAEQMYIIPKPSNSIPFTVWWPSIQNVMEFNTAPSGPNRWAEQNLQWWIDDTKPPLKS